MYKESDIEDVKKVLEKHFPQIPKDPIIKMVDDDERSFEWFVNTK